MPDWMNALSEVDFVIGCRIHGTMAAIAAGKAALILPTDFRTLEMAQAMKLPMIFGSELDRLNPNNFNLSAVINAVCTTYDFKAFEDTRRIAVRKYQEILHGMDLEVHPALQRLLDHSDQRRASQSNKKVRVRS